MGIVCEANVEMAKQHSAQGLGVSPSVHGGGVGWLVGRLLENSVNVFFYYFRPFEVAVN